MRSYVRKSTLLAAGIMLAIGLALGSVAGGTLLRPAPAAHAAGENGALEIMTDGSFLTFGTPLGFTTQPAGTCTFEGNSDAADCNFTLAPHDGGAIVENGVAECFFIQPDGGAFTSFNSEIVYAPSGQVHVRCER